MAKWNEADHPRDKDGRFSTNNAATRSAVLEDPPKEKREITSGSDARDLKELDTYMQKKYGVYMHKSCEKVPFEVIRRGIKGFEKMQEMYPELKNQVESFGADDAPHGSWVMECRQPDFGGKERIVYNASVFKSVEAFERTCREQAKIGFWPKNSSIDSVMAHECAHALHTIVGRERFKKTGKRKFAEATVDHALEKARAHGVDRGKSDYELKKEISGYAAKRDNECFADAMADCYANGSKASPLSKEIKHSFDWAYKKWMGG